MNNTMFDNGAVRRQDRLMDESQALQLLEKGEYGFLSMVENRESQSAGYGLPISYVWDGDASIYFHCGPEGHKLVCLDSHPQVSFCVVGSTHVIPRKFTTNYQSVMLRGEVTRRLPEDERLHALELIIRKYAPELHEVGMMYAQKSFHRTEILKLTIHSISAKAKQVAP